MSKWFEELCFLSAISFVLVFPVHAAAPYYEGKTIRLIVGFSAGGGFDTYSRLIGRHLGKHIPGNPAIVVENMTGAASLVAANHVYKVAKPDGLTILNFHGNQVINQIIGKPGIEFRDKFLARIVPQLPLAKQPVGKRGHLYGTWDGRPYLFSFMKRVSGDKTFYVVIEDDLIHMVNTVFPQFFSVAAAS